MSILRWKCARCQTEYFEPGECDWCPDVERTPVSEGSPYLLIAQLLNMVKSLQLKAARWDALILASHRMGGKCKEVIDYVIEKVQDK